MENYSLQDAEALIAEFFPVTNKRDGRGIRFITFNGDTIFNPAQFRKMLVALRLAFAQSWRVGLYNGDSFTFRLYTSGGVYFDRYSIAFVGEQWKGPEAGGIIPELKVTYHQTSNGDLLVEDIVECDDSPYAQLQRENEELKERLARSQDVAIDTVLRREIAKRDGEIFKRGKIQHRGAHRALTLAAPGATLEAGTSPVSCCAHLDWTEPGEDMTKPHHTKCVNYS